MNGYILMYAAILKKGSIVKVLEVGDRKSKINSTITISTDMLAECFLEICHRVFWNWRFFAIRFHELKDKISVSQTPQEKSAGGTFTHFSCIEQFQNKLPCKSNFSPPFSSVSNRLSSV